MVKHTHQLAIKEAKRTTISGISDFIKSVEYGTKHISYQT